MSERKYAAELDDTDSVVRVIVGDAEWATEMLGGRWVDSEQKLGISWRSRQRGFVPWEIPLDPSDSLATLLAVKGILPVEEAANAVGLLPVDLVHEAEAWAVASGSSGPEKPVGRLRAWWRRRTQKTTPEGEL